MNLSRLIHIPKPALLVAGAYGVFAISMAAQVQTDSQTTTMGAASHAVTVERGEVLQVIGNDLIVKMEDGQVRHFPNVSESAKVNVDGKQLGIHDLKPGMKLQRTITVTTVPKTVTTVQSVRGKVWQVSPPLSVILTLEDNTNQKFTIPKGQKFTVDGQTTDAFGLKKGMMISATKVVEVPETVVEHQRVLTGKLPPPPPPPPADTPILIISQNTMTPPPPTRASASPAPAAAEPTTMAKAEPKQLPKTGSMAPLLGLLGLLSVALSFSIRALRRL